MKKIITYLMLQFLLSTVVFAQAPLDDHRRPVDAMVAQGNAGSMATGINPAGIRSTKDLKKETYLSFLPLPVMKISTSTFIFNTIFDIGNARQRFASSVPSINTSIEEAVNLGKTFTGARSSTSTLTENTALTTDLIAAMDPTVWKKLAGSAGLNSDPSQVTAADIENLNQGQIDSLVSSASNLSEEELRTVSTNVANGLVQNLIDNVFSNNLNTKLYVDIFRLQSTRRRGNKLSTGFSLEVGAKASIDSDSVRSADISTRLNNVDININIPLAFQFYTEANSRYDIAIELIEGLTFGFGPNVSLFFGIDEKSLSTIISSSLNLGRSIGASDLGQASLNNLAYLNWGIDAGIIFNFGALLKPLQFLSIGANFRDALGFTHNLTALTDARYAGDIDVGAYLSQKIGKKNLIHLYGGVELLEIRNMLDNTNSYSVLTDPLDHLHIKAGIGFLNELIDLSVSFYDSNIIPSAHFNLGPISIGAFVEFGVKKDQIGAGIDIYLKLKRKNRAFINEQKKAERLAENQGAEALSTDSKTQDEIAREKLDEQLAAIPRENL